MTGHLRGENGHLEIHFSAINRGRGGADFWSEKLEKQAKLWQNFSSPNFPQNRNPKEDWKKKWN